MGLQFPIPVKVAKREWACYRKWNRLGEDGCGRHYMAQTCRWSVGSQLYSSSGAKAERETKRGLQIQKRRTRGTKTQPRLSEKFGGDAMRTCRRECVVDSGDIYRVRLEEKIRFFKLLLSRAKPTRVYIVGCNWSHLGGNRHTFEGIWETSHLTSNYLMKTKQFDNENVTCAKSVSKCFNFFTGSIAGWTPKSN